MSLPPPPLSNKDAVAAQRQHFGTGATSDDMLAVSSSDCPGSGVLSGCPSDPGQISTNAHFAPAGQWRKPSDYVAHLARKFEQGKVDPHTGKLAPRPLKRDQVLFLAQFAFACNTVWKEERDDVAMSKRHRFSLLLIGEGGTGKTAIVQEVVLPAADFIFPMEGATEKPSLVVCAKWSQAENISTAEYKAISCHRAGLIGVQSYRNKHMHPQGKKAALTRAWNGKRVLIIEEVGTVGPPLYNMLLYRSWHGRARKYEVPESEYDKLHGAFGRMPIVIQLGDFLQLKPTGSKLTLISDVRQMEEAGEIDGDIPAEYQQAMRLFCHTPLCFELRATSRFKDPKLRDMIAFMRCPTATLPQHIGGYWNSIQMRQSDTRLCEERFQIGHMLAIYWDTVSRWMMMRARRDAATLQMPLFVLQAADSCSPAMPRDLVGKLLNRPNPKDTGSIHGILLVHVGMIIRLLEALDLEKGLVKDAEGEVVHVVVNPADQVPGVHVTVVIICNERFGLHAQRAISALRCGRVVRFDIRLCFTTSLNRSD